MSARLTPLVVRAELAAGIAHAAPWGVALDGLLAAEVWSRLKPGQPPGSPALDADDPPDLDLPLARCTPPSGPWHWAATCAYPDPVPRRLDVHIWSGRVDHRHLELVAASMPAVMSSRQGRYRSRLMPLLVLPCTAVTWHAVGDAAALRELLSGIVAIGKKRSQGEGHVLSWAVEEAPALTPFAAAHLNPGNTLGRPCPAACLDGTNTPDGGSGRAGVRPPYMHRSRQNLLRLPAPLATDRDEQ